MTFVVTVTTAKLGTRALGNRNSLLKGMNCRAGCREFNLKMRKHCMVTGGLQVTPSLAFFFPGSGIAKLSMGVGFRCIFGFDGSKRKFSICPLTKFNVRGGFCKGRSTRVSKRRMGMNESGADGFTFGLNNNVALPLSRRDCLGTRTGFVFTRSSGIIVVLKCKCGFWVLVAGTAPVTFCACGCRTVSLQRATSFL